MAGSTSQDSDGGEKGVSALGGIVVGGSASSDGRAKQQKGVHTVDWRVLREMRELIEREVTQDLDLLAVDGEEPGVSAQDLSDCWLKVADLEQRRQGAGALSARDREFIEVRVSQSMREVDMNGTGVVNKDEWLHHMLLTRSSPRTMKAMMQINTLLENALDECPGILVGLQHGFEVACEAVLAKDELEEGAVKEAEEPPSRGRLPTREVLGVFGRKLWQFRPRPPEGKGTSKGTTGFNATSVDDFVEDIIHG